MSENLTKKQKRPSLGKEPGASFERKKSEALDVGRVGGISFLLFIFFCAWMGMMILWVPMLPCLFLIPSVWRKHRDLTGASWLAMCAAFLEYIIGIKFVFSGDAVSSSETALVISNHRNRLDWMFMWSWFARYGRLTNEKIVLKAPLKWLPGPGWATQLLCFLFLNRNWEQDRLHMEKWIEYFKIIDYPLQLHLFPEGSDLSKSNLEKSHAFSEKKGLQKYDYVMHPRVKGFTFFVQKLRNNLDSIFDATLGYPSGIAESEFDLIKGIFPREIHIHIKEYKMRDLPKSEAEIDQWCKNRWAEKEDRLREFYDHAEEAKEQGRVIPTFDNKYNSEIKPLNMIGSLIFWIFMLLFAFYMLFQYSLARWYLFTVNIVFFALSKLKVGFDEIECNLGTSVEKKKAS